MAQALPDGLNDSHAAEDQGLRRHASLLSIGLLGTLMLVAMLGLLAGGKARPLTIDTPAATLTVISPRVMRNGLFFETRVLVTAKAPLAEPTLMLSASLWRDMTINTQLPDAKEQAFKDGSFRFTYDALQPGGTLELKFDGQINPPLTIGTAGEVALADGDRTVARLPVYIRVLP